MRSFLSQIKVVSLSYYCYFNLVSIAQVYLRPVSAVSNKCYTHITNSNPLEDSKYSVWVTEFTLFPVLSLAKAYVLTFLFSSFIKVWHESKWFRIWLVSDPCEHRYELLSSGIYSPLYSGKVSRTPPVLIPYSYAHIASNCDTVHAVKL
jgi:hypothetical protein